MTSPTRLANKTQWAIMDTIARCKKAKERWAKAMQQAERNLDPNMMLLLAHLRDDIAVIEDIQKAALKGEYEQKGAE